MKKVKNSSPKVRKVVLTGFFKSELSDHEFEELLTQVYLDLVDNNIITECNVTKSNKKEIALLEEKFESGEERVSYASEDNVLIFNRK